jgi:putative transcriptional regulator
MTDLLEMLLIDYAAGHLPSHKAFVVATLLAISPEARRKVQRFEAIGGSVIEDQDPADMCGSCLDKVLARIDGEAAAPEPEPVPDTIYGLPEHLCRLWTCAQLEHAQWKRSGDAEHLALRLSACAFQRNTLSLMRLPPGCETYAHTHAGSEIKLVLEGGFTDRFGHYRKGALQIIPDARVPHAAKADGDGCLCLVLTEGLPRFVAEVQRFVVRIFR